MKLSPLVPGFIVIGTAVGRTVTAIPESDRERWLAGVPVPAIRMSLVGLTDPVDTLSERELREIVRRVRDEMYRDSTGTLTPNVDAGADQLALVYQALDGSGLRPADEDDVEVRMWLVRMVVGPRWETHTVIADDALGALAVALRGGAYQIEPGPPAADSDEPDVTICRLIMERPVQVVIHDGEVS